MTDAPKVIPIENKDAAIPAEKKADVVAPATAVPAAAPEVEKK